MSLASLVYWHWLILGVGLLIAEALLPGSFLWWFGLSALATGGVLFLIPGLVWQFQLTLFAMLAVAAIVIWRRVRTRDPATDGHPTLNRRGHQYIGRRLTLNAPIVDGIGRLHIDDMTWRIEGADLPAGAHVTVTGVDGTVLRIEKAD